MTGKIYNDIFFAPSIIVPVVAGGICLVAGVVLSAPALMIVGGVAVVGGIAWGVGRSFFGIASIAKRAARYAVEETRQTEEKRIEQLAIALRTDRDYRTKDLLAMIRENLRNARSFADDASETRYIVLIHQMNDLASRALDQLEESYRLYVQQERLVGESRDQIVEQREQAIRDIGSISNQLQRAVAEFRKMKEQEIDLDVDRMREELDFSLTVAKRTEEQMRVLEQTWAPVEQRTTRVDE